MYVIFEQILKNNDCYTAGVRRATTKYLVVHSPAVTKIGWYKVEKDAIVSGNQWFERWNKPGIGKCTHGFIDHDGVHKFLPEDYFGWHCRSGIMHNMSMGFEFCEYYDPVLFNKLWRVGVEHYAYLAKKYNVPIKNIIGHQEAYKLGLASNHGDPEPYFNHFGKSMEQFRNEVKAAMYKPQEEESLPMEVNPDMANLLENVTVLTNFDWKDPVRKIQSVDYVPVYDRHIDKEGKTVIRTLHKGNLLRVLTKLSGGKGGCGVIIVDHEDPAKQTFGFIDCYGLAELK